MHDLRQSYHNPPWHHRQSYWIQSPLPMGLYGMVATLPSCLKMSPIALSVYCPLIGSSAIKWLHKIKGHDDDGVTRKNSANTGMNWQMEGKLGMRKKRRYVAWFNYKRSKMTLILSDRKMVYFKNNSSVVDYVYVRNSGYFRVCIFGPYVVNNDCSRFERLTIHCYPGSPLKVLAVVIACYI